MNEEPTDLEPNLHLNSQQKRRAEVLFLISQRSQYLWADRLFFWFFPAQWIGCVIAALWISPMTWNGAQGEIHLHVWLAVFLGGAIIALPLYLIKYQPGAAFTRHIVAVGQMLLSALMIHLTGGRIETHFHVFGSLVYLSFYRDWRILATATVVVVIDHFVRGVYFPISVFGTNAPGDYRWIEHGAWVLFEDATLILGCRQGVAEMRASAQRRAVLEETNAFVEEKVRERTAQLHNNQRLLLANENELLRARDEAQSANQAKSEFLANMSHEIRSPLTAILGFTDVMIDYPSEREPDKLLGHLASIKRNSEHLVVIIDDILDLSKIEAGKLQVIKARCNLLALIEDVDSIMRPRAESKGLRFDVAFSGPVPRHVQTDATRVRQILLNLTANAIKFTETGSVRLVVQFVAPSLLFVEVHDTGPGIAEDDLRHLFKPFSQIDASATRRFGGNGLGLAISKRLAAIMDSDVQVQSELGKGSVFTLKLDVGEVDRMDVEDSLKGPDLASSRKSQGDARPGSLPVRVLVAEDGPDNQRLIAFHLRKVGADVVVVENGQEAVDAWSRDRNSAAPFEVILMDMQMPVLDGYSATRRLRELGCDLPIVALTAHAMKGDREKCLGAGCSGYETKPITPKSLIKTIAEVVAIGHAESVRNREIVLS